MKGACDAVDSTLVHARTPDNVDRLLDFLTRVHARYRGRPGGQPLGPSRAALEGPGLSIRGILAGD